ncbi:radical SAM protein [Candidatus Woesearchaeota archaeon]|nr:radical SAM protein [Candidatus Woesearchaeota archaeon]
MSPVVKTQYHSWCTGNLSEGCIQCVNGRKLVLFITGLCAQRCWYCPVSEQKFGEDVAFANEWKISDPKNPVELFEEARLTNATGAGITGGDPLVLTERCVEYIKLLKKRFGKEFHIHLYTPLKLVTQERLKKLYDAGLDEIRFHPNIEDKTLWDRLNLAKQFKWKIGIEIPVIPFLEKEMKELIDYAKGKIDFINLNELERSDTQTSHYKIDERNLKQKDAISYGVKGSKELALKLLKYAQSKGLAAHFCTAKLKDSVQMKNRLQIRAKNAKYDFDEMTEEGLLLRGCAYLKQLAPGAGYREKIKQADKQKLLRELEIIRKTVLSKWETPIEIDSEKLRIILPIEFVKKHKLALKKIGVILAIVEEYPTADAIEMTVDFL